MEIKGIKYVAPFFDMSGYAQASRGYATALHRLGIPLTVSPVSFEKGESDQGEVGKTLRSLINKDIDYNVVIAQLTPEHYQKTREPNKLNVGYSVWETSKLHPYWVEQINETVDVIMTASEWGVDVYKDSGIEVPVFSVPHGIDMAEYKDIEPYDIGGVDPTVYKFYGIFQFTERKNPLSLIKSYWHAFQNNENVALVLKTYKMGFADEEKKSIKDTISKLKQLIPFDNYPPIYLILDMLSREEILGLHRAGDCCISLDRGEGFGLVPFEAGACGNPVILTGWGGALEYAKPEHSYLVNYRLEPVFGMPWSPWYRGEQLWAQPNCEQAIKHMRYVYNNQSEAANKGRMLKQYIAENFSWDQMGLRIMEIIKSI